MNDPAGNERQVLFLHVPKTAGTTVRGIAYAHYREARVAPIYPNEPQYLGVEEFAGLPAELKDRADFVIGHVTYGFHRFLSGRRPFRYATLLRDPIRRCASLYNHLVTRLPRGEAPTFPQMLERPEGLQFNNQQTRQLSGLDPPFGQCPRAMLDQARENIERSFDFVGITELFDESLLLAELALGWPLRPYETRNVARRNLHWRRRQVAGELTGVHLEQLTELNALDQELYEFARARLLAQLSSAMPRWQERVAEFRRAVQVAPARRPAMKSLGHLDPLRADRIAGWSKLAGRDMVTRVRIQISGRKSQLVKASHKRDDLRTAGVHFAAACGFTLDLPADAGLRPGDTVRAFNADTGQELADSPRMFGAETTV